MSEEEVCFDLFFPFDLDIIHYCLARATQLSLSS